MNDVILITGGSDGYGKAAAKRFAEALKMNNFPLS